MGDSQQAAASAIAAGLQHIDRCQGRQGRVLVGCNELRILIDISHLNNAGFWEILEFSQQLVVVSHSNCRAISPNPRNLDDEQVRALARNGGLVGVTFALRFLWPGMGEHTDVPLELVGDHIAHIFDLVGMEHVAIGTDLDS